MDTPHIALIGLRRAVVEAVQRRLDEHPEKMRQRRETVEHPFGTIKARMGATHFLTKTLPRVASEMALHVLAYNLTRVMNIMDIRPLMAAMRASQTRKRLFNATRPKLLRFPTEVRWFGGRVCDITSVGARLEFPAASVLATDFNLTFDAKKMDRLEDNAKMKSPGCSSDHCSKRSEAAVAGIPKTHSVKAA